jgi:hypothetical protein
MSTLQEEAKKCLARIDALSAKRNEHLEAAKRLQGAIEAVYNEYPLAVLHVGTPAWTERTLEIIRSNPRYAK